MKRPPHGNIRLLDGDRALGTLQIPSDIYSRARSACGVLSPVYKPVKPM